MNSSEAKKKIDEYNTKSLILDDKIVVTRRKIKIIINKIEHIKKEINTLFNKKADLENCVSQTIVEQRSIEAEKQIILESFMKFGGRFSIGDKAFYYGSSVDVINKNVDLKSLNIYYSIEHASGKQVHKISDNDSELIENFEGKDNPLNNKPLSEISNDAHERFIQCSKADMYSTTYKSKLGKFQTLMISFLIDKDSLVFKETGIHLISVEDIKDVYDWSEEFCKHFLINFDAKADSRMCPWCYLFFPGFKEAYAFKLRYRPCTYGLRNGFCSSNCSMVCYETNKKKGVYRDIFANLDGSICNSIIGMDKLIGNYRFKAFSV